MENALKSDNDVILILHKKIRSLKKKLEKIQSLESNLKDGKILNQQQQDVVGNKRYVVKCLTEFESMKESMMNLVLTNENIERKTNENEKENVEIEILSTSVEMQTMEMKTVEKETQVEMKMKEEASLVSKMMSCQVEEVKQDDVNRNSKKDISKSDDVAQLLRLMHAVTWQQAMGYPVPTPLDFFVKVLLGTTRPPAEVAFEDNLATSIEQAELYLRRNSSIVAGDFSYEQLWETVQEMGNAPTFNFFAE